MAQNCGIFIVQKNIKNKGKNIKNKEIYLIIDILFARMNRKYVNFSGFFLGLENCNQRNVDSVL